MFMPILTDAHLVNGRSLSAQIRMFDGKVIYSFMLHPEGRFIYQHLMVNTVDHEFETIPVFAI